MEDRKELSKSAPSTGRRMSKDKAKKMTTLKDINTWIDRGEPQTNVKGSRNVGMLTENVTEQRLLYTRQQELGRERYKFLSSHSYEKTKFVELQNRKSKSMKKMMQNARRIIETSHSKPVTAKRRITVRVPQMEEPNEASNKELSDVDKSEQTPIVESRPVSILAKPIEERPPSKGPDEKRKVRFPQPVRSAKKPSISGRAVYIALSNSYTESRKTPDVARKTPDSERSSERLPSLQQPQQRKQNATYSSRNNSGTSRRSGRNSALEKSKQAVAALNRSAETTPKLDIQEDQLLQWRLKKGRRFSEYGHKFSSSVGDPRYVALTNTLVPCDDLGKPIISVDDIIAKKEILRGDSMCEQKSRAKQLHARFIAYLLEQELR